MAGEISPFVATAGDILMTLALAAILLLPMGCGAAFPASRAFGLVASCCRGRWYWPDERRRCLARRLLVDARFNFETRVREARLSLPVALLLILRLGLPLTAFFVAINPIWGFTWYFNTESWASGIYQKLTELQVDRWRGAMIDAVTLAYGDHADELFRVHPTGAEGIDFSFLVIGDPGRAIPPNIRSLRVTWNSGARGGEIPRRRVGRDLSCRGHERL